MKIRNAALALIMAASCVITSGSALPVWAEAPGETALDQGLEGYWNFDGADPMENQGNNTDLAASLSGDAVSVQESSEEELGNVLPVSYTHLLGALEYRSVRLETDVLDCENYQGNAVVNYTDREVPYTRVILSLIHI